MGDRRVADEDRLARVEIRAPVAVTVKKLMIYTVGGVTTAAARLATVVPMDARLIVETMDRIALRRNEIACSMSQSGNVCDNAAKERFFSSLKAERVRGKINRTRDAARAGVFDDIERFYNTIGRHSTIGYLSLVELEKKVGLA